MANKVISAPSGLSLPVLEPSAGDAYSPGHLTGRLELLWTTANKRWVSPGTGRLVLATRGGDSVVAQGAARRGGLPILPGPGLKGSVRMIYELLTRSCDPFRGCRTCPACKLFGYLGQMGRVSFSDAVPAGPDGVSMSLEKVPEAWEPRPEKTLGDFRVYDLARATVLDQGSKKVVLAPQTLWREAYRGHFRGAFRFENLAREELGILLISLGLGRSRHLLRVGGVRFDGQGAVAVDPGELTLWRPRGGGLPVRDDLDPQAASRWCADLVAEAEDSPWGREAESTLVRLANLLGSREVAP